MSERLSRAGKMAVGRGADEADKRRITICFLRKAMVLVLPIVAREGSLKRYTGVLEE